MWTNMIKMNVKMALCRVHIAFSSYGWHFYFCYSSILAFRLFDFFFSLVPPKWTFIMCLVLRLFCLYTTFSTKKEKKSEIRITQHVLSCSQSPSISCKHMKTNIHSILLEKSIFLLFFLQIFLFAYCFSASFFSCFKYFFRFIRLMAQKLFNFLTILCVVNSSRATLYESRSVLLLLLF